MHVVACFFWIQASCRRNFSLDVVFANASGHLVSKDIEVVCLFLAAGIGLFVLQMLL